MLFRMRNKPVLTTCGDMRRHVSVDWPLRVRYTNCTMGYKFQA